MHSPQSPRSQHIAHTPVTDPLPTLSRRQGLIGLGGVWAAWAGVAGSTHAAPSAGGPVANLHPLYHVSHQGRLAGQARVEAEAEAGRLTVRFSVRDNGRGPDITERLALDEAGRVRHYEAEGTSTFGALIGERFDFAADGRIRWSSRVDQGDQAAQADEWFLPLEPTPVYLGLLALGVWRARRHASTPVALTAGGPGMRTSVAHRMSLPRRGGTGPAEALALELWALEGLDVAPMWLWFESAPTPRFFGLLEGGQAVLPPGFEDQSERLAEVQARVQDEQLQRRHAELTQSLPGLTRIASVRWFDAPQARLRGPSDVWLLDGRIRSITEPGAWRVMPERDIDGRGCTLLPGLFDMHGHLSRGDLLMNLAFGVTTVRDMGNDNAELLRLKASVEQGRLAGPSIVPLGFIEGKSPFASSGGILASSLQEALDAVDWYRARGVRQLKLYNSIKPEWVAPVVRHARARGLRVGGHVPAFMRAEEVVRAGFDEISHINQVMLNFVVRPGDDTRTLQRFTRVGDDAHAVGLDTPHARRFLKLLGARRTVVDPTLVAFEAMYTQQQGELNPSVADLADHLPPTWKRRLKVAEFDLSGNRLRTYQGSWARLLALTGALHRAGAVVVPGTDGLTGLGLHRELALMVQAGFSPAEALRAATHTSAVVCGVQDRTGRIAPGLQADLLLVEGNPLEQLSDLRRARLVVRGHSAHEPAALQRALGFKPLMA